TLGIPIARLADRGVRRTIIAAAVGLWSLMTALCGLTQNFWQLFAARMGVGVGEAGALPPSQSLIADYFPPERRSSAMAVLTVGTNLGVICGMVGGSFIAESLGWRWAFFLLGVPGVLFAVLIRLTLKEPPRHGISVDPTGLGRPSLLTSFRKLLARPTYVHMLIGFSVANFAAYGSGQWTVAFFMRTYGVPLSTIAPMAGTLQAVLGTISILLGGVVGDRLARRDVRWHLWLPSGGIAIVIPIVIAFYLAPTWQSGLVIASFAHLVSGIYAGPILAAVQGVVDPRSRALSVSLLLFATSLIGFGLGPLGVGILSDLLEPRLGNQSLRWALVLSTGLYPWTVVHLWIASKSYVADIRRAAEDSD
ncbi:MAG: spinster family MFS transporter, partial [Candidatus Binatia bacterium]